MFVTVLHKTTRGCFCLALLLACRGHIIADQSGSGDGSASEVAGESSAVKVIVKRDGDENHFYVENQEFGEVTATFEMSLVNLKGDVEFPYTMTFPPRQTTEAFALKPLNSCTNWGYSYTNYYKLGSNCARPDESCVYELPYAPGSKFKVTQGYNGKYSHTGSNQYATDWQMPVGTLVCAARDGVVVRTKDDCNKAGPSMAYDRYCNYVLIRHPDGTLGHYCHLQKGGALVEVGQRVTAGEPIAHSGNTGFSTGPHLHFCVFVTRNGRERVSLPVKFRTTTDDAITLVSGRAYRAAETPAPIVQTSVPVAHVGGANMQVN
jgi:murein DD-endopeptidase MepM/ murein hydrolase activator NlpD